MTPTETVDAIYAAFRRGDIPFILAQMAPDVVMRQPASVPWGGDYRGPGEVGGFFRKLAEIVEPLGLDVDETVASGDCVVSFGHFPSRHRGTGKVANARFAFRWHFAGGQATRFESILDSAVVVAAATP